MKYLKLTQLACTVGLALTLSSVANAAIITDGNVQLGIQDTGALNVPGGTASPVTGTRAVGLRYTPTGNEATSHGCLCEGWGVGIGDSGVAGWDGNGFSNLTVDSFTSTATTATSVTSLTSGELQVTHDFALAEETDNLFRARVSITNTSGVDISDLRYTRVMDWDVEPTTFREFVTIDGTAEASAVLFAHDDGFESANPFASRTPILDSGDFEDSGPADHGALFDFGFGALAAGETFEFDIFYGGAATEAEALASLGEVGAEVYSLGQSSIDAEGTGAGGSNTFIFGFSGVGGEPLPDPTPVPELSAVSGPLSIAILGTLLSLGAERRRKRAK